MSDTVLEETPAEPVGLAELLVPNLDALNEGIRASWRPEITDLSLRDALFENPRLRPRILREVLAERGMSMRDELANFVGEAELRYVLAQDYDDVMIVIGTAYHANTLAVLASRGMLSVAAPELTRDQVKAALSFRDLAALADPDLKLSPRRLRLDGQDCFSDWINGLPRRISERVHLRLPEGRLSQDPVEMRLRRKLCFAVLQWQAGTA